MNNAQDPYDLEEDAMDENIQVGNAETNPMEGDIQRLPKIL